MTTKSSSHSIASRGHAFLQTLINELQHSLRTDADSNASLTLPRAAIRAHLLTAIDALPDTKGKLKHVKEWMKEKKQIEAAVTAIEAAFQPMTAAAAVPVTPALFSDAAYEQQLAAIDAQEEESDQDVDEVNGSAYLPLFLPPSAPPTVADHLLSNLTQRAKRNANSPSPTSPSSASILASYATMRLLLLPHGHTSTAVILSHMEQVLQLVRTLPLHPVQLPPITAIIDTLTRRFNHAFTAAASSSFDPIIVHSLRRFQNVSALLLLEEEKRQVSDAFRRPDQLQRTLARIRSILRRPLPDHVTGSLSGELMFVSHALVALKEYKRVEKLHRAAVISRSSHHSSGGSGSGGSARKRSRSRDRSRSPSRSRDTIDHQDVPLFHAAPFMALIQPLIMDVAQQLATSCRVGGDHEAELLRWALLLHTSPEHLSPLSTSYQPLRDLLRRVATTLPTLPIPLSLRPMLQRYNLSSLTHANQLWQREEGDSSTGPRPMRVPLAKIQRMLTELDGELQIETEPKNKRLGDDADSNEEKESSSTATASASSAPLFFIDTGVSSDAASANAAAVAASTDESDVASSMTRTLRSIPQAEIEGDSKKKRKREQQEEEEENEEENEEDEEDEEDGAENEQSEAAMDEDEEDSTGEGGDVSNEADAISNELCDAISATTPAPSSTKTRRTRSRKQPQQEEAGHGDGENEDGARKKPEQDSTEQATATRPKRSARVKKQK